MNTKPGLRLITTLWLGFLLPAAALSQQENQSQTPPADPTNEPEPSATANDDQPDFGTPIERAKPAAKAADVRNLVGRLRKLQAAMHQRLNLRRSQQEAIDSLFTTYRQSLRGGPPRVRKLGDEIKAASGLAQLRRRLKEANRARDRQAVERIRQELHDKTKSQMQKAPPPISRFLSFLSAELRGDQRKQFRAIVRTLRIGKTPSKRSGLRTLWRAVLRPEMELSDQQRKTISSLLRDGLSEEAASRRDGNAEAMTEIGERVRSEILEVLTPEQRTKFTAARKKPRKPPPPSEIERPTPIPSTPDPDEPPGEDDQTTTDPPQPGRG